MYVLVEIAGQITSHTVWYVCTRGCNYSASLHPAGTGLAFRGVSEGGAIAPPPTFWQNRRRRRQRGHAALLLALLLAPPF